MHDLLPLTGKLNLTLTDANGRLKDARELTNLIVTTGKAFFAAAGLSASTSPFTEIAVGTDSTGATLADTTLGAELARQVFSSSSVVSNIITMTTTYAAGVGTGALQEAGIFNAATAGTMLSRVVFAVINKGAADSLTVTWTITVG